MKDYQTILAKNWATGLIITLWGVAIGLSIYVFYYLMHDPKLI